MTSGQDGYTKIPNTLLEALARTGLNGTQLSICLFILRRTSGWGREDDSITLREFAAACGSEEKYISKQLKELVNVRVIKRAGGAGRPAVFSLNLDTTQWLCGDGVVQKDKGCPKGQGSGVVQKDKGCPKGQGSGVVQKDKGCPKGQGSGVVQKDKGCPKGQGSGVVQKDKGCPKGQGGSENPQDQAAQGLKSIKDPEGVVQKDKGCLNGQGVSKKTRVNGTSALEPQGFAARLKKDLDLDVIDDVDIDRARENLPAVWIQEALQQAGILAPSPLQVEKLTAWLADGLELAVVLWAIEKAALANVRRVDYINAICKNLYNAGVRTLEQARAAAARYEASRYAAERCEASRQRPGNRRQPRAAPPPGDAVAYDPEQAAAREKKRRLIESLYCN